MLAGATILDPASTHIDAGVTIEPDAVIEPFTVLRGATTGGEGAIVGPHVVAVDARIGAEASVGPFRVRCDPGRCSSGAPRPARSSSSRTPSWASGAKVPHLSYIGDAEIGSRPPMWAPAAITANYDGRIQAADGDRDATSTRVATMCLSRR